MTALHCSFCGRPDSHRRMVVGKGIAIICSECIAGAAAVLARSTLPSVRLTETAPPAIGDLDPVFRSFAAGEISLGRVHEIVRNWRDGLPIVLPPLPPSPGRNGK